jgi:hypothetical protein
MALIFSYLTLGSGVSEIASYLWTASMESQSVSVSIEQVAAKVYLLLYK